MKLSMKPGFGDRSIHCDKQHLSRLQARALQKIGQSIPRMLIQDVDQTLDWRFYLDYYADLEAITTYQMACEHWLLFGQIEGRFPNAVVLHEYLALRQQELPSDFEAESYILLNPDLRGLIKHRYRREQAIEHYLEHGRQENRPYHSSFDWHFYRQYYEDLTDICSYAAACEHWINFGEAEGRFYCEHDLKIAIDQRRPELPNGFDYQIYLQLNPDLDARFTSHQYREYQAIEHFLNHGQLEGRRFGLMLGHRRCFQSTIDENDWGIPNHHLSQSYQAWIINNEIDAAGYADQVQAAKQLAYQPLISIITPVYNLSPDILFETIQSVIDQTYENWELCLVEAASTEYDLKPLLDHVSRRDLRIKVQFLAQNQGIAANSNLALKAATGEFIALLDHDDLLAPFALYEVVKRLNQCPTDDVIYSDEDKIELNGKRHSPFFKPDWNPDLLTGFMYVGHLTVYRRRLIEALEGFRSEFDFSQDYDLLLRAAERTDRIGHIPKVLYHWRVIRGSAAAGDKGFARASNLAALADAAQRRGYDAEVLEYPTANRLRLRLPEYPLVSIIIPSDREDLLLTCLDSLFLSGYPNFEIVIVTNSGLGQRISSAYAASTGRASRIKIVPFDLPYNFSAKCNRGAEVAQGKYVLLLNDDVRPIDRDWIESLVAVAEQDGIGSVSPKLLYETGQIQYAGMVTGVRGLVGTAFHQFPGDSTAYANYIQSPRAVSILCGACALIRRDLYQLVGGFDEVNTPIMGSDVDLSFKLRERGLRLVYTPFATLTHLGHASISKAKQRSVKLFEDKADLYLLKRWGQYLSEDPYFTERMRELLYHDSPVPYRLYASNASHVSTSRCDVLLVSHELSRTGAPLMLLTLASWLCQTGYFVTLVSPTAGPLLKDYRQLGIPCIIDPLIQESPGSLHHLIKNYDVVVANTILFSRLVRTCKAYHQPVIWMVHEGDFGRQLAQTDMGVQQALREADYVLFPCDQARQLYQPFRGSSRHLTVHNCIRVIGSPPPVSSSVARGRFKIVQVGSIEYRKGQDITLKAIQRLQDCYQDVFEFYFIGRAHDRGLYEQLLSQSQHLNNVHWIGEVSPQAAQAYIAQSDIVVCSSRDETGPIFVLEGMYFGKVIISTQVGVVPEVIEHGISGLFFQQEDFVGLAQNLVNISANPVLFQQLGQSAQRQFEQRFTVEQYGKTLAGLINELHTVRSANANR